MVGKCLLILGLLLLIFLSPSCVHSVVQTVSPLWSLLMKPFADHSGHLVEEGVCEIVRAGHEGWRVDQRQFHDVSTTGHSG